MGMHLELAEEPMGGDTVETVTHDSFSRTLALKMIRKLRLWLEMVRALGEVAEHMCVTSGLSPGRSRH